jgi:putative ABC transport system ATP-binding protein
MLIEIQDLRHGFADKAVLDIPSWRLAEGQHSLLLGPSGSGKTTLLNVIAGLMTPKSGSVAVAGQPLGALSGAALDRFRGRNIGFVFQSLHLVKALSVVGNLRLARYLAGLAPDEARIGRALAALGIGDKADQSPRSLSQGEAQRVAIARAVVNAPKLILADEPTSALDDRSCNQVLELLLEQADDCGATLLIATHDARLRDRFPNRLDLGEARP